MRGLRAFEVHAVDYLLKPFDRSRLRESLRQARALTAGPGEVGRRLQALVTGALAGRPARRLVIRTGGRVLFVRAEEVDWIEATGHYLTVHTGREAHLMRETLGGLEARLDPRRFVRIHRSTMFNVDRIRELQRSFHGECEITLRDGTRLSCSRTYSERLERALEG
jgi:two-component system LytT family response regulator